MEIKWVYAHSNCRIWVAGDLNPKILHEIFVFAFSVAYGVQLAPSVYEVRADEITPTCVGKQNVCLSIQFPKIALEIRFHYS